jgi:two-component system, chemotaxis family, CheB/CheR fusion protein
MMSQIDVDLAELTAGIWPALVRSKPADSHQPDDLTEPSRLLDVLPAALYVTDAAGRIIYFNEAAAALWGCRPKLHSDQWCGSWRLFERDGTPLPHDQCPMAIALKEGKANRGHEAVAERPDGTRVPFMAFPTPFHDASGVLVGAVNVLVDISEHQRAERVARRLASIVESSDDAIISKDLNGTIATWNRAAERLFGYAAEEVIGKSITILIPAERMDEEVDILDRIRRGERIEHFETKRRRKDGSIVDISLTVSPVTDESGKIIGASKIARDITEHKRREEQIALLAREADHRTNNLLAIAQATVHLTRAETTSGLKAAIEGRLRALANAHGMLAQTRWAGADLRELVVKELSPYFRNGDPRALIEGASLLLKPELAQAMAMALHELATNAVKYGALSTAAGRVKVKWQQHGNRLRLRWIETEGPCVALPKKEGFGTRAITRMIGQLNGKAKFDWRADGLNCEIAVVIAGADSAPGGRKRGKDRQPRRRPSEI